MAAILACMTLKEGITMSLLLNIVSDKGKSRLKVVKHLHIFILFNFLVVKVCYSLLFYSSCSYTCISIMPCSIG